MYKVPGHAIVSDTIGGWIRQVIWYYIIVRLFKDNIDEIGRSYVKQQKMMLGSIIKKFNARCDEEFNNYD